jgi:hypothetical protein
VFFEIKIYRTVSREQKEDGWILQTSGVGQELNGGGNQDRGRETGAGRPGKTRTGAGETREGKKENEVRVMK